MFQMSRRKLLSTGTSLLIAQVATAAAGIVTARALGPEGKGIVAAVTAWPQVTAWVLLLGLGTATSVRVSESRVSLEHCLGNAVLYSLTIGAAGTLASFFILPGAMTRLGAGAADAARITVVVIPLVMLGEVVAGINLALGRTAHYNAARIFGGTVVLAASLILVGIDSATPETIAAAGALSGLSGLVVGAIGLPWCQVGFALKSLWSDVAFGVRVFLTGLLGLINVRLDLLLMSTFIGANEIGWYSVAINAMLPIALISTTVSTLLLPTIGQVRGARAAEAAIDSSYVRRTAARYSLLTIAVALAVAGSLPLALPWLFGDEFRPAIVLAWILLPGMVAHGYAMIVDYGMVGMRRPWVGNVTQGSGVIVTAIMLPLLLPAYGATGAAITSSVAYTVSATVAVWALNRVNKTPPSDNASLLLASQILGSQRRTAPQESQ